jgi:hypothetical protein
MYCMYRAVGASHEISLQVCMDFNQCVVQALRQIEAQSHGHRRRRLTNLLPFRLIGLWMQQQRVMGELAASRAVRANN